MKAIAFIKGKAKLVEIPESTLLVFPQRDLTLNDLLLCTTVEAVKYEDLHINEYEGEEDD